MVLLVPDRIGVMAKQSERDFAFVRYRRQLAEVSDSVLDVFGLGRRDEFDFGTLAVNPRRDL